jgi:oxygen-independent coproporphyrinogen-3 oxidase
VSSSLPIFREASLGASDALAHPSASGIAQITTESRPLQGKTSTITLESVIAGTTDLPDQAGRALETAVIEGAYLHVPFCFHKCHYCDFYSIVDNQDRQEAFTNRLIDEMRLVAPRITRPPKTIFIGGGTPTLLEVGHWRSLLAAIGERLPLQEGGEFTVEANPETVTDELAEVLAAGGVNRVSIGAQSFDPRHLKTLERWHDPANVARSVDMLGRAGITNLNLD